MNPSRPPALRPSLPSVMKPYREGPSTVKPTQEELQARVESLSKKNKSVKRKAQAPLESSLTIRGKSRGWEHIPPSTAKEWGLSDQVSVRGQAPPSMAEMSKVAGPKYPSGRTAKPPLEVLPIFVWSPSAQNTNLPPTKPKDEGIDCFGTEGDEDSLLTNSELAVEAVSSILRDTDFKRADAKSVEEATTLSLQGPPYVHTPLFVRSTVVSNYLLFLSRFCKWLHIRKAWRGGPALPRALLGQ